MKNYTITKLANEKAHDYHVSTMLPEGYAFYTEGGENGVQYLEICDTEAWDRIVHIEKQVITDKDVDNLVLKFKKLI